MILRRLAEAIAEQNWFTVMLEVLIVVVGIFIGLQADDWNQERRDRIDEQLYLAELMEDFDANQTSLDQMTEQLKEILVAMNGLMEQSALEAPTWSVQELNAAIRRIQEMPFFLPVSRAYDNLTGSGELQILQSRALKNTFALYFAKAEVVELVMRTHEMELVQTFQPYIIENMDYQAVGLERKQGFSHPPAVNETRILDVLQTPEFRNIAMQKWIISNDLLNQFYDQRGLNTGIIEILKSELAGG
jgi:hypothetical protein